MTLSLFLLLYLESSSSLPVHGAARCRGGRQAGHVAPARGHGRTPASGARQQHTWAGRCQRWRAAMMHTCGVWTVEPELARRRASPARSRTEPSRSRSGWASPSIVGPTKADKLWESPTQCIDQRFSSRWKLLPPF